MAKQELKWPSNDRYKLRDLCVVMGFGSRKGFTKVFEVNKYSRKITDIKYFNKHEKNNRKET